MWKRLLIAGAVVAVALFAVQGGEYGTTDLLQQRAKRQRLVEQIQKLQREVDSLGAVKRAVETDPVVQERIAREEFGMVKGKELLYRFIDEEEGSR